MSSHGIYAMISSTPPPSPSGALDQTASKAAELILVGENLQPPSPFKGGSAPNKILKGGGSSKLRI